MNNDSLQIAIIEIEKSFQLQQEIVFEFGVKRYYKRANKS